MSALAALAALALAAPPAPGPEAAADDDPPILERPIPFGSERGRLTLEYRQKHEDPQARSMRIAPRLIVLHHTATRDLDSAVAAFTPARLPPARRELAKGGALNVSAHFVIDRDGRIYRLLPETTFARHAIGVNHLAIGVENVGGTPDAPLTDAQVQANAALVRALVRRFPAIDRLIGHHELPRLDGLPERVELVPGYATVKVDPGPRFMAAVRARVRDLGLKGAP